MKITPIQSRHPWIDKQSTSLESSEVVFPHLAEIIEEYKKSSSDTAPPTFIFDLDSTLFEVRFRAKRILHEFAQTHLCPEKDFLHYSWVRELSPWRMLYSLKDTASINQYPYTENSAALLRKIESYWFDRFFRQEYIYYDIPVLGAPSYVRSVEAMGVKIMYLTGRAENVRRSTELSLLHWGFPKGDLLMKPTFYEDDSEFKGKALAPLRDKLNVLAIFDNEPANFPHFERNFPDAKLVFVHSVCSKKIAANVRSVMKIENFLI